MLFGIALVLGEGPAVALGILGDVGAIAPEHVLECRDDVGSRALGLLAVGVHVIDVPIDYRENEALIEEMKMAVGP